MTKKLLNIILSFSVMFNVIPMVVSGADTGVVYAPAGANVSELMSLNSLSGNGVLYGDDELSTIIEKVQSGSTLKVDSKLYKVKPYITSYYEDFETDSAEKQWYGYGYTEKTDTNGVTNTVRRTTDGELMFTSNTANQDCFADFFPQYINEDFVIEADLCSTKLGTAVNIFFLRGIKNGTNHDKTLLNLTEAGKLKAGTKSVTMSKNRWYHVVALVSPKNGKCNVTITTNGFRVLSSGDFTYDTDPADYLKLIRIYMCSGGSLGNLKMDNFKVYNGIKSRDTSSDIVVPVERFYTGFNINDKRAVHGYSGTYMENGIKKNLSSDAVCADDEIYVSEADAEILLGKSISVSDDSVTIGEKSFDIAKTGDLVQLTTLKEYDLNNKDASQNSLIFYNNGVSTPFLYKDGVEGAIIPSEALEKGKTSTKELNFSDFSVIGADGEIYTAEILMYPNGDYDALYFYNRNYDYVAGKDYKTGVFSIASDGKIYSKNNIVGTVDLLKPVKIAVSIERASSNYIFRFFVNGKMTVEATRTVKDTGWFRFGLWTDGTSRERGKSFLAVDEYKFLKGDYLSFVSQEINPYHIKEMGGTLMFPVKTLANALGLCAVSDNHGLVVIGNTTFTLSSTELKEIGNYLFHVRPDTEVILENSAPMQTVHPRILADKNKFDEIRSSVESTVTEWKNSLILKADNYLNYSLPVYSKPDGLRLLETSKAVVERMLLFGFAYKMTGDEKYFNRAKETVDAVKTFPDFNGDNHFLDTGEMCFGLSVAYDWFYEKWTSEERLEIYNLVKNLGLKPAENVYNGTYKGSSDFWYKTNINWNSVCNGGVATAALAMLEEEPEYCAFIIKRALRGFEYAWYELAPDGGWEEGIGYWGYYMTYAMRFLSSLKLTTGTDYGMFGYKGVDKTGAFQMNVSSQVAPNNFHDAGQGHASVAAMHYLSDALNDESFSALRTKYITDRLQSVEIEDVLWYSNGNLPLNMPLDSYYKGVEAVSMREKWFDKNAAFVSFHGGKTEGGHNHYDGGSFVYDVNGERWALDLGAEDYTLTDATGSAIPKEKIYRVRAEGHNTLVMNPGEEAGQDTDGFGEIVAFEYTDNMAYASLDMSSYYKKYANSVTRDYYFQDNRRSLIIKDEMNLKSDTEVYWFMHTRASVELGADGKSVELSRNGKKVILTASSDKEFEILKFSANGLETSKLPGGQSSNSGVTRIAIRLNASGKTCLTVKLSPDSEGINSYIDCVDDFCMNNFEKTSSKVSFTSHSNFEKQLNVVFAKYENGKLASVESKEISVNGLARKYEIPGNGDRVFVWEKDSLEPLYH